MNLAQRTELLATAIGTAIKTLNLKVGEPSLLATDVKTNTVAAINEVLAKANAANQSSLVGTSDDYNQATGLEELPDVWNGFTLMQAIGTLKTIVNHNSNFYLKSDDAPHTKRAGEIPGPLI